MSDPLQLQLDTVFRNASRQVFASLARALRDLDLAEDAMQESFAAATIQWPHEGIPENPVAWLVTAGRRKAVDVIRRREKLKEISSEVAQRLHQVAQTNASRAATEIEDDRLRLIFTCCHPAIDLKVQVPLTLREVCGLTTEEIARAFLTTPATMAQRIVRGKAKIRDARIPFVIPSITELPERLDAVLTVIYLIFNEGYSASSGDSITRADLSGEAIRLCRLVLELLEDAEVMGLLALMLLHESRRETRQTDEGDIVLLEDQDRSRWDRSLIDEGRRLVERSLASRRFGFYTIQAAISAVHAEAPTAKATDWNQIVALYDILLRIESSAVIELNRAVAVAMWDGPAAGLQLIEVILDRGDLLDYSLAHAARGELLRRAGRHADAIEALETALSLTGQSTEQRFLAKKLQKLKSS
ncbi:RNA polymerase sigma factor [Roseimaritima ulvae]|uniref:RNA polymerase sigma factor n=1 Tax=Roseimaritima ulvae TaxID=980254 RepID=A0A5B9QU23_9BACT|nr:RNA polymerase sigma factor [Roseimaritima ulvae]QEG40905.1 RNA polymerase sigma factor [Roseimaritima ulvae]